MISFAAGKVKILNWIKRRKMTGEIYPKELKKIFIIAEKNIILNSSFIFI